jgi:hypothetical protein
MGSIRTQDRQAPVLRLPLQGFAAGNTTASGHGRQQEEDPEGLDRIEADIAAGTFDYRRYFPASKNAARFDAAPAVSVAVT